MATLDNLRREIRLKGERIARAAAIATEQRLQSTSPVKTKQLKKSLTVRVKSVGDVIVTEAVAAAPHAAPVIKGAKPHIIRPVRKKFLAFQWAKAGEGLRRLPDGRVLLRQVNHPGNEPNLFWDDGLKQWKLYLQQAASRLR